jgi:IS30 family transposase
MIKELTAVEARDISLSSTKVDKHLESIFAAIGDKARNGEFKLHYVSREKTNIYTLQERLLRLGYAVESDDAESIDLVIMWS